jgi:hypothetical protein
VTWFFPVLQDLQAAYAAKVFNFNGKEPELSTFSLKIHLQRVRKSMPMEKAAEPWNADLATQWKDDVTKSQLAL